MSSKSRFTIALLFVVVTSMTFTTFADAQRPRRDRQTEPRYALLAIDDEIHIVIASEVRERLRAERERHATAVREYRVRRADARDRELDFDEEPPEAPELTVLSSSIRGKKEAEVKRARYLAKRKGWKRGNFAVIRIADEFRIVSKAEINDLREALETEYEKVLAAYEREKERAEQRGDAFDAEPPVKPDLRVAPKTFTTEIEARHYIEAYLERLERSRNRGGDGERGAGE